MLAEHGCSLPEVFFGGDAATEADQDLLFVSHAIRIYFLLSAGQKKVAKKNPPRGRAPPPAATPPVAHGAHPTIMVVGLLLLPLEPPVEAPSTPKLLRVVVCRVSESFPQYPLPVVRSFFALFWQERGQHLSVFHSQCP